MLAFHDEDADPGKKQLSKPWSKIEHPRGPNGRFIVKGSADALSAAHASLDGLRHHEHTPDNVKKAVEHLSILTVKQLRALRDEHKLAAKGKLKADLIAAIAERLPGSGKTKEQESERDNPAGSGPTAPAPEDAGGKVASAPGGPPDPEGSGSGANGSEPADKGTARHFPASRKSIGKRLDRFTNFFHSKGQHQVADWMEKLKSHIDTVGTDEALASLGDEVRGKGEEVQYAGHALGDDADFVEAYLDRNGITMLHATVPEGERRVVATVAASSDSEGTQARGDARDVFAKNQTLKNKLHEAQHLPGLEKSEDLSKLTGGEAGGAVENFTPEVLKKLDETYGKDGWIVKAYGDDAFAGFGIFFPQRVRQLQQDAQNIIWNAGEHVAKYGFKLRRDKDNKVVGLEHKSGHHYDFGTEKYAGTISGDVRHWADMVANDRIVKDPDGNDINVGSPASSEHGTSLPEGRDPGSGRGREFMAQPAFPVVGISEAERAAGITFKKGQEGRVHIVTRDGKAEIVPHSTWLKKEHLPVVFEDDNSRSMAKAALDAINALPESERQGQLYAPDVVPTAQGHKVVEANPANEAGASGYLQSNPFIIDSYVSHVTGREPAHVRFIRKLLNSKNGGGAV